MQPNYSGTDQINPEILHPHLLQLHGSHTSKFTTCLRGEHFRT